MSTHNSMQPNTEQNNDMTTVQNNTFNDENIPELGIYLNGTKHCGVQAMDIRYQL